MEESQEKNYETKKIKEGKRKKEIKKEKGGRKDDERKML